MRSSRTDGSAVVLLLSLILTGCSGGTPRAAVQEISYVGNAYGGSGIGTVEIRTGMLALPGPTPGAAPSRLPGAATGLLRFSSGYQNVNLQGHFDAGTDRVVLEASEWRVAGALSADRFLGEFSGPEGPGVFIAQRRTGEPPDGRAFCGVFEIRAGIAICGTSAVGVMYWPPGTGSGILLSGTYSPIDSSWVLADADDPGSPSAGTGRLITNAYTTYARGVFRIPSGDSARWSGYSFH